MPSLTARSPAAGRNRLGFTLIEAVMVMLIIATVVGMLMPSVMRTVTHARINRAARVVASDFYLAQSSASRSRKPVSVTVDATLKTITMTDTQSATQLYIRRFDNNSEFKLQGLVGTPATVVVFPSGMQSASVSVQVGTSTYQRFVNISRAGQIRIQ